MSENILKQNAAETQFIPVSRYDVDFAPLTISGDVMIEPQQLNVRYHAGRVHKADFF